MSRRARLLRWGAATATCAVLGSALAAPDRLPAPVYRTVDKAVTQAAHFWLWVLNQPRDAADDPSSLWRVGRADFRHAMPVEQIHGTEA